MNAIAVAVSGLLLIGVATGASFTYDQTSATTGPQSWAAMTNTQCSNTASPSPIDLKLDIALSTVSMQYMGPLDVLTYETVAHFITASNDGANLYFEFGSDLRYSYIRDPTDSRIVTMYQLSMMRFHSPSEHTFGGGHYDGEIQLHWTPSSAYPRSTGDKAAIVVVIPVSANILGGNAELELLFNLASFIPTNTALSSTLNSTTLAQEPNNNPQAFRVSNLIPPKPTYITYDGSLSNPPCTRNYRYVVFTTPTRVNLRTYTWLRSRLGYTMTPDVNGVLAGNYRPVQTSSALQKVYREMGEITDFVVQSTGKGSSMSAKTKSIASLVISGVTIIALVLAVASLVSMVRRVDSAVTEMNPTSSNSNQVVKENNDKEPLTQDKKKTQ